MSSPVRLLILVSSTGSGGAERMAITLANQLVQRVSMRFVTGRIGALHQNIDPAVEVIDLDVSRMRYALRPLRRLLREWSPTVVFAPQVDASMLLALAWRLAGRPGVLILRESNYRSGQARMRFLSSTSLILRWAYHQALCVVAPARAIAEDLEAIHRLDRNRIKTIHNPIDLPHIREQAAGSKGETHIKPKNPPTEFKLISVGRLVRQKGFDLLLPAFAFALKNTSLINMSLTIIGDGPERLHLERLIDQLDLGSSVHIPGVTANPYTLIAQADFFVLSSRWEGFPNAMVEAMSLGVPPVAYRCPGAITEIIEHSQSGLLCEPESVESLGAALAHVSCDFQLREHLSNGATERAKAFNAIEIAEKYLELFNSTSLRTGVSC